MPTLYECTITLHEPTFFSSRELSVFYQTEPLIGNIALAYAFGWCQAPYFNDGTIYYRAHLGELNTRGIYITPATPIGAPRFTLQAFNAQPDSYTSAMGQGYLAAPSETGYITKDGANWYTVNAEGRHKLRAANRPQYGRLRAMAIGMQFRAYIISQTTLTVPRYIRLGKFMSKARVDSTVHTVDSEMVDTVTIPYLLALPDLPPALTLHTYDFVNVPPVPLVQNVRVSGNCYLLPGGGWLPMGMAFYV